jgi:hypothetical protein
MQPPTRLEYPGDLGQYQAEVRHRLRHVPADDQVEAGIGDIEREGVALRVGDAIAEGHAVAPRACKVAFEDVDAGQRRLRIALRKPARDLAGAAAQVQDAQRAGQPVAIEQHLFLRPDRLRLVRQIARHRLVAHLFGLRIAL